MRDLAWRLSDDFSQLKTTKGSKHLKFTDEWNLKQANIGQGSRSIGFLLAIQSKS